MPFPSDKHHGWKFIAFGPDGRPLRAGRARRATSASRPDRCTRTITRIDLNGGRPEVVAPGVRNSVGFDFQPETGELWFTDNGRDMLGDDQPPDELNRLMRPGAHFGSPTATGDGLRDPDFNKGRACDQFTAPARLLGPHVAAPRHALLYRTDVSREVPRAASSSPSTARGTARPPIGYRVTFVKIEGGRRRLL